MCRAYGAWFCAPCPQHKAWKECGTRRVIDEALDRAKIPDAERLSRIAEILGRAGFTDLDAEAGRDKAYKESLKKIPDAKAPADPWGIARGLDTPKSLDNKSVDNKSVDKTSAPAKPRTKTGSTAN